ncbi:MAG TPA: ABC transporter permease subunit [Roseiflexaceae bacterium]|nr:ABC transporter permease subunit [Roseiflexaceae bacterium]
MAQTIGAETQPAPTSARAMPRPTWAWLGVVPFFGFVAAFLFYPALSIVIQTFLDTSRNFTLQNIRDLNQPFIITSYIYTIQLSAVTALIGGLLGFLLAYAITLGRLPQWIRSAILTFSGVASNFAGVPLAFAFIATLGVQGLITQWLRSIGIALYPRFSLYSFWGLAITYIYFQIPLMVLVMAPALDSLKQEWREASENLGASAAQYWRYVALPILLPSLLGTMALLFGNAFGAQATAFALTGGGAQGSVVTILIGAQLSSDALSNPGLGNALAFGMIVIMTITITIYSVMRRLSERWLQ